MRSGVRIHQELQDFSGVNALKLEPSIKKELKSLKNFCYFLFFLN
jgi:hypothetical protein